jgi:hypothetical protein
MVERMGIIFGLGAPYLSGDEDESGNQGGNYGFPGNAGSEGRKFWTEKFKGHREGMGDHLLEKFRSYGTIFDISGMDSPGNINVSDSERAVVLHFGGGGRWFEFCAPGTSFLQFHNIDRLSEAMAGFNLATDALEFLDETFKGPRISIVDGSYEVRYPLVEGNSLLVNPPGCLSNPRIFSKWFDTFGLEDAKVTRDPFEYKFKSGRVFEDEGEIVGQVSYGWQVPGTTYVMAKLLDSFTFAP